MRKLISLNIILSIIGITTAAFSADEIQLTLVNADTGKDIKILNDGDVLNRATLPSENLNIRADILALPDEKIQSVSFVLQGATTINQKEKSHPYTMAGDERNKSYRPFNFKTGEHSLDVKAYTTDPTTNYSVSISFEIADIEPETMGLSH